MNKLVKLYESITESGLRSAILIGIVCLCTFGNTVLNDYNLDDNLVTQNHRLTSKGIKAIPEIYRSPYYQDDMGYSYGYRPTTLASFAIEHELFGESATVGHTINLLLYLSTCILIFFLIKRIFPDQAGVALGAALLFTVHPIHTEVVASIKNRDEILSLLFSLLGCFVLFRPKYFVPSLLLASVLFFLSLSSKLSAVNLILLLALVPAYPKPFIKDLALLCLYAVSLYFVFEGRDVFGDNRARNISLLAAAFLIVRILLNEEYRTVLSLRFTQLKKSFINSIPRLIIIKLDAFLAFKFRPSRLLEIAVATFTTVAVLSQLSITWFTSYSYIFVIISFFVWRTNQFDAFLRFSIPLIIAGALPESWEFSIVGGFLLFSFSDFALKQLIGFYVLFIALSIGVFTLNINYFPSHKLLGVLTVYSWQILSAVLFKKNWRIYAVVTTIVTGLELIVGLSLFSSEFLNSQLPLLVILIFLPIPILVGKKSLKLNFCSGITKYSFGWFSANVSKLSAVIFLSFFTFVLISEGRPNVEHDSIFSIPMQSISNTVIEASEWITINSAVPTKEYWSGVEIHSWKRPFDFVEHPLNPFGPAGVKYGTAATILNQYLGKLFVPHPLAFYYGFDEVRIENLLSIPSLLSIILHLLLLWLAVRFRKKNSLLSIGLILYLTCIVLFSGLAEIVAGMFSDRFSYVASFGFCLAIAAGMQQVLKAINKYAVRIMVMTLSILVCTSFSGYSIYRNALWKDKLTLMRNDIKHVPNSAQAHNLLAHAIMEDVFSDGSISEREKVEQAVEAAGHFEMATQIYPQFFNAFLDLGRVYRANGSTEKAINAYEQALKIDSTYTPLLLDLANLSEALGNYDAAIEYYRAYLNSNPPDFEVYDAFAHLLFRIKKYEESIAVCEEYLRSDPGKEEFIRNISVMKSLLNTTSVDAE